MKHFMFSVLCISAVCGEAIPEALTFDRVQETYQEGSNVSIQPKDTSKGIVKPLAEPKPVVVTPAVVKPVVPVEPKPVVVTPAVVKPVVPVLARTVVTSPEVNAVKARANRLYGQEVGYVGVTDAIVTSNDGQRFLYINIKGDGNCGFYASGISRATFVQTIEELVNVLHGIYQEFLDGRSNLALDIMTLMLESDKKAVSDKVRQIANRADDDSGVAASLGILTDFQRREKEYREELFQDARNDFIKTLQRLGDFATVRSMGVLVEKINDLINKLAGASHHDVGVRNSIETGVNAIVSALDILGPERPKIQRAMEGITDVLTWSDVQLFEKAKSRLINKIENLTTLSNYEAFLVALRKELEESGMRSDSLETKENVLDSVHAVFSMNRGSAAWFPGGLLGAIKDSLHIKYNIWGFDPAGFVSLISTSNSNGVPEKGETVRHMFFTGGHYDMLIPFEN